jgi:hypothetical protein
MESVKAGLCLVAQGIRIEAYFRLSNANLSDYSLFPENGETSLEQATHFCVESETFMKSR